MAIDANIKVMDAEVTITNTQTIAADTQVTAVEAPIVVAGMHRNMLMGENGASGRHHSVGAACYLFIPQCLPVA